MNELDNKRLAEQAEWIRRNDLRDWLPPHSGGPPILPPRILPAPEVDMSIYLQNTTALVEMMRDRGVKEFQTADLRVVFREEGTSAPDHQTTNDDPQPEARPRRYPGGRLVSVPTGDDE